LQPTLRRRSDRRRRPSWRTYAPACLALPALARLCRAGRRAECCFSAANRLALRAPPVRSGTSRRSSLHALPSWGPLGPVEPARAIDIYFLPFTPPLKLDTPLDSQLEGFFGPFLSPIVVFLVTFFIQQQINGFRREQEMKVASAAANAVGGAVSSAATGAAKSFGERLASVTGDQWAKLAACLLIDALGDATYLLPGLGEAGDALYAPFEFLALRSLFGGSNTLALFGFVEEALPFSDAMPTATAAWLLQALFPENPVAKFFGIGEKDQPATTPPQSSDKINKPKK